MAVSPFKNIVIFVLVGPIKIIDINIRQWLWAHPGISTSSLQWAHSGFSATLFGDGCGPIQEYHHLCFGWPTQDYQHQYLAMAMGPPTNIDISLQWAHSGFSATLFRDGCGPIQEYRRLCFGGPTWVIDINIWQWLWAHPG
jgi:hypothetical protein